MASSPYSFHGASGLYVFYDLDSLFDIKSVSPVACATSLSGAATTACTVFSKARLAEAWSLLQDMCLPDQGGNFGLALTELHQLSHLFTCREHEHLSRHNAFVWRQRLAEAEIPVFWRMPDLSRRVLSLDQLPDGTFGQESDVGDRLLSCFQFTDLANTDVKGGVEGEDYQCPLCYLRIESTEEFVVCVSQCRQAFHKDCKKWWVEQRTKDGKAITCGYCQAMWLDTFDIQHETKAWEEERQMKEKQAWVLTKEEKKAALTISLEEYIRRLENLQYSPYLRELEDKEFERKAKLRVRRVLAPDSDDED